MTNRESDTSPGTSSHRPGWDDLLDYMRKARLPPTRENYLAIAYPDGMPEEWTQELENELPPEFRQSLSKLTKPAASATKSAPLSGAALQQFATKMGQEIVDSLNRAALDENSPNSPAQPEQSPPQ